MSGLLEAKVFPSQCRTEACSEIVPAIVWEHLIESYFVAIDTNC